MDKRYQPEANPLSLALIQAKSLKKILDFIKVKDLTLISRQLKDGLKISNIDIAWTTLSNWQMCFHGSYQD